MRGLARWCMVHRRRVIVAWVAVAILATVLSHAVGPNYVTVFGLPGTESQRAGDLLKQEFKAQGGDVDTIVFHVSHGTIDSPQVQATITPLLGRISRLAHVAGVVSPYGPRGAVQVSANRMTAFATINYDKARTCCRRRHTTPTRPRARSQPHRSRRLPKRPHTRRYALARTKRNLAHLQGKFMMGAAGFEPATSRV